MTGMLSGVLAMMSVSGCKSDPVLADAPSIEVGAASPQDSPVPTGDATAPDLPQIKVLDACAKLVEDIHVIVQCVAGVAILCLRSTRSIDCQRDGRLTPRVHEG